jgi:pectate lyase
MKHRWILIAALVCAHEVRAALLLEEPFPYAPGTLSGQGDWSGGSGTTVSAGSLTFPGLRDPTVTSNKATLPVTASTAFKPFATTPLTNGAVYLSFILRQTTLTTSTTGGTLAGLDDDGAVTTSNGRVAAALAVHLKQTNSTRYLLGIRKGQGSSGAGGGSDVFHTAASFATGEVVFVVAKYTFLPGAGDDTVALWVNPDPGSFGASEPPPNIAETTTGNASDAPGLRYVFLRCNSSTVTGVNEVDNVRVGTSWADVTPGFGGTGGTRPYITEAAAGAGVFTLRGTNGTPGAAYQVLSSTELSAPTWSALATNQFLGDGSFVCSVPLALSEPQRFFRLEVLAPSGPPPTPPEITSQPADQTVSEGDDATFSVTATGTPPLFYQWFFNTNTPLPGATASSLTLTNVQTNSAGVYQVVVTNVAGAVTSAPAQLLVLPAGASPIGFAAVNGITTGGRGGPVVTVTNASGFLTEIARVGPRIVRVQGTITLTDNARPASHKTIVGVGTNATIVGNLNIYNVSNVIVQNLHFTNPGGVGDGDGVTIEKSHHVWVDHCTFYDCADGALDTTHGSDYVTISWCRFFYTADSGHNFACLVGHSANNAAEDAGRLRVTYHHNWWSTLCVERMPRTRFGRVHVFNNFYDCTGNNYCVRASIGSEVLVENNYFENIHTPYEKYVENGQTGLIRAQGNATVNCSNVQAFNDTVFVPPYTYPLETPADARAAVIAGAGAGNGAFP